MQTVVRIALMCALPFFFKFFYDRYLNARINVVQFYANNFVLLTFWGIKKVTDSV